MENGELPGFTAVHLHHIYMTKTKPNDLRETRKRLVDANTIAEPLGVTGRTVLNWAHEGKIPIALRVGKVIRFDPEIVAQALGLP